jgi:enoyl-CoA hydratase
VPRERVPELVAALAGLAWRDGSERAQVEEVLASFHRDPGDKPLAMRRAAIDRCFAAENVETILDALAREAASGGPDGEWAAETRALLLTKSPTSLQVTLRQPIVGRGYDLEQALMLEYRMTQHFMEGHDFYEGVRAVVVDKDQNPRWQPATLAEISDAKVEGYFAPLGDRELTFA